MAPEHHFHLEVLAPNGLAGLEPHLSRSQLPLEPYCSGFTKQVILRLAEDRDDIEFDMQGSLTETLHASGYLAGALEHAYELLDSLSRALRAANFSHQILLDDGSSDRTLIIDQRELPTFQSDCDT